MRRMRCRWRYWMGSIVSKYWKGDEVIFQIDNESKMVGLKVQPLTPGNKPATVDGPITYTVDDDTLCVVNVDPNDSSVIEVETKTDAEGLATITINADADLGEGVVPITGSFQVSVVKPQATNFGITPGTIVPK
jgi:hypothetical protein